MKANITKYMSPVYGDIFLIEKGSSKLLTFSEIPIKDIRNNSISELIQKFPMETVLTRSVDYSSDDALRYLASRELSEINRKVLIIGGGLGQLSRWYVRDSKRNQVTTIEKCPVITKLAKLYSDTDCVVADGYHFVMDINPKKPETRYGATIIDAFDKGADSIVESFTHSNFVGKLSGISKIVAYNAYGMSNSSIKKLENKYIMASGARYRSTIIREVNGHKVILFYLNK